MHDFITVVSFRVLLLLLLFEVMRVLSCYFFLRTEICADLVLYCVMQSVSKERGEFLRLVKNEVDV